jgi:zinc protease
MRLLPTTRRWALSVATAALIASLWALPLSAAPPATPAAGKPAPSKSTARKAPAKAAPTKAATAKSPASKAAAEAPLFDYKEITLDNGLHVITLEDFSCPVVNVQLWYHVGSKDEQETRQGFAHMFEHMMFRGTKRLGPTDHFDFIRRTGGTCNAYTSFDQTVYHETLPSSQLELALWLEAERMSGLKIDQKSFDTERKVVEEERRMGLNRPFGTLEEQIMADVFHEHPYRWTPIGKIPHLRASAVQELRDFWNRYYVPNNATLVIVGAVKHAEAQQLAKRNFGWIPRAADPPRVKATEPMPTAARAITLHEANAPAPLVGVIFRTTAYADKDEVPLELLGKILVGDNSSRLYRSLVAEKKLAVQTVDIGNTLEQDGLVFAAAVVPPFGAKPEAALAAVEAEINRLREEPVSDHELTKARNQMLKETVESTLTVEGKAALLGRAALLEGGAARANERLDAIRRVTIADLTRVAKQYLAPERLTAVTIPASGGGPGGKKNPEEDAPITAKPETNPPPPGRPGVARPAGSLTSPPLAAVAGGQLPDYPHTTQTLPNGLKVIVVPNHEVPYVSVRLGLLAGAWTESKPGVASMTLDLLTKGTKKHNEAQLADELGTYAISLNGSGGMDSSSLSADCLTEQLERTLGLLAEVALEPTFPAGEFDTLRGQVLAGLKVSSRQPTYLVRRELHHRLFGGHPYARTATGEIDDVNKLELGDLRAWWTRFARPDMAVLIFAGDVEPDRAIELAKKTFGGWEAEGPKPDVKLPAFPAPSGTHIYLVDDPTSTQSQICVGQLGIPRQDPQYFTTRVVNGYFGGAFTSRLNETIRVKRGLTYGAHGGFSPQRFGGEFVVSTFSKTESTSAALQAVFDEVRRLQSEPPSADELGKTKSYLVGNFVIDRETPEDVAGDLWTIQVNNLPDDYYQRELTAVAGTGQDACVQVARERIDPAKMVVVVVGAADKLKAELEKIAPVTVVKEE